MDLHKDKKKGVGILILAALQGGYANKLRSLIMLYLFVYLLSYSCDLILKCLCQSIVCY
jgi:hypothetical protein